MLDHCDAVATMAQQQLHFPGNIAEGLDCASSLPTLSANDRSVVGSLDSNKDGNPSDGRTTS